MELEALIEGLSRPEAHVLLSARGAPPERIHTHISVVFLVDREVVKIHKPVDLGFLDFTTLAARERDCRAEVEVNQRLAPGVYRGVLAIVREASGELSVRPETAPGAGPSLGPEEAIVEWAVWMRRLPDSATFRALLGRRALRASQLQALAEVLAAFYAEGADQAAAHPELARLGDRAAVEANVEQNFEQLGALVEAAHAQGEPPPVDAELLARLEQATRAVLGEVGPRLHARHEAGAIRDTHGDLRLDHVYDLRCTGEGEQWLVEDGQSGTQIGTQVGTGPGAELLLLDRIEFGPRFRWADPISDVAFLMMDLQARGEWVLARGFAEAFADASGGDTAEAMAALLPFYLGYRATVRAKVAAMAAAEPEIGEAARARARTKAQARLLLALTELSDSSQRPCLLLVGGLPGTGKSVLAQGLSERGGFQWIRTDTVRKSLAGLAPSERGSAELYSKIWTERTYAACLAEAEATCTAGGRAIVDATFVSGARRSQFVDAAARWGVAVHFLVLDLPPEIARARIEARAGEGSDPSDADFAVYEALSELWSPVDASACPWDSVDASGTPAQTLDAACAALTRAGLL
ncbi:hypothetical protein PPSIR1_13955 [Plesiocystis pacifica SIR-1]|uniref:Aminoglycoside phosphotransferase domain-containing protein n=1 Tax=Plesiocystis pacifica SIR-1 TaxID=391625 RepID=A6G8X6_9BACT|nr:AAA family ATPase [Plesiocystis pacifica]EDM77662.1 hypothetical protein PPSIR1_13955 [Plesiocystis pacifica SIR-1]